jgi:monoamine oxidase
MARTPLFDAVRRALRIATWCERTGLSTAEGLARVAEATEGAVDRGRSRRELLAEVGRLTAAGAVASLAGPVPRALARPAARPAPSVGIVGAGLAGLACGDALRSKGIVASLYDASTRPGGRCFSLRGFFPGQVAERGGEFIDNLHKTMLGYAQRFGLAIEDVTRPPGDVAYFFDGQHWPESVVVDEFRDFVAAMRVDLRRLSREVTAADHTDADVALDRTNLLEYVEGGNGAGLAAGPVAREAIVQAYIAEYGRAPDEQSCLNFLLFIHADRRSKFTPFGVFSDERFHVVDGNDRIAEALAGGLATQIEPEMHLVRLRATPAGRLELTFRRGAATLTRVHDVVVLAIPFTTLREVELDANLGFPPAKLDAIRLLGYGDNAKMMVGFSGRPWAAQGSNGTSYSDLPNHQTTWETNPGAATATRAVLTDYSGAARGAGLDPGAPDVEAERFLADLDLVYPGAAAAATRIAGAPLVHLEHWPSNPLTKGSYTCYLPGQFTSIAGIEGMRVGQIHFAGEHVNSFFEFQGFMEGAALSGIDAATEILREARR